MWIYKHWLFNAFFHWAYSMTKKLGGNTRRRRFASRFTASTKYPKLGVIIDFITLPDAQRNPYDRVNRKSNAILRLRLVYHFGPIDFSLYTSGYHQIYILHTYLYTFIYTELTLYACDNIIQCKTFHASAGDFYIIYIYFFFYVWWKNIIIFSFRYLLIMYIY